MARACLLGLAISIARATSLVLHTQWLIIRTQQCLAGFGPRTLCSTSTDSGSCAYCDSCQLIDSRFLRNSCKFVGSRSSFGSCGLAGLPRLRRGSRICIGSCTQIGLLSTIGLASCLARAQPLVLAVVMTCPTCGGASA